MQVKKLLSSLIVVTLLTSCGSNESLKDRTSELVPDPEAQQKDQPITVIPGNGSDSAFIGYYVGYFDAVKVNEKKSPMKTNKINISVDSVRGEKIYGHSVVAGNSRPFTGSIKESAIKTVYDVIVKEPGDDKYDGEFSFVLNTTRKEAMGKWVANDKKLAVTERSFNLSRKNFKYNPDQKLDVTHTEIYNTDDGDQSEAFTEDAGKFNASNTELKSEDVENMYKRDLEVLRNAIYARHGYSFKNRQMRNFFDYVDWYIPVSTNITSQLTVLEKKNIELIKRYEEHAIAYYDVYGR